MTQCFTTCLVGLQIEGQPKISVYDVRSNLIYENLAHAKICNFTNFFHGFWTIGKQTRWIWPYCGTKNKRWKLQPLYRQGLTCLRCALLCVVLYLEHGFGGDQSARCGPSRLSQARDSFQVSLFFSWHLLFILIALALCKCDGRLLLSSCYMYIMALLHVL